jgi:hypothetical protein
VGDSGCQACWEAGPAVWGGGREETDAACRGERFQDLQETLPLWTGKGAEPSMAGDNTGLISWPAPPRGRWAITGQRAQLGT